MHQPTEATLDIAASKMRSPLAALARSTLRVCLWDRPTLAVLILVQILLLLPALMGYPTLSDQAIGQEQARQTREILSTSTANGVYDSAPADLKDINARELTVLGEAASTPYPSRDFFDAYARYYDIELESVKAGYSEPDPSLYARSELIHRLAQLENPEVYDTAAEMSVTYYLVFVLGLMPGIVPLLPIALLASASQRRLATRSLEQAAPIHRAKKRTTALGVALALALAVLALELAPAALLALVRNGLGNLAYPVVQIVDGNVASATVREVLAKDMALIMGAALVTTALAATAEAILPRCGLGSPWPYSLRRSFPCMPRGRRNGRRLRATFPARTSRVEASWACRSMPTGSTSASSRARRGSWVAPRSWHLQRYWFSRPFSLTRYKKDPAQGGCRGGSHDHVP